MPSKPPKASNPSATCAALGIVMLLQLTIIFQLWKYTEDQFRLLSTQLMQQQQQFWDKANRRCDYQSNTNPRAAVAPMANNINNRIPVVSTSASQRKKLQRIGATSVTTAYVDVLQNLTVWTTQPKLVQEDRLSFVYYAGTDKKTPIILPNVIIALCAPATAANQIMGFRKHPLPPCPEMNEESEDDELSPTALFLTRDWPRNTAISLFLHFADDENKAPKIQKKDLFLTTSAWSPTSNNKQQQQQQQQRPYWSLPDSVWDVQDCRRAAYTTFCNSLLEANRCEQHYNSDGKGSVGFQPRTKFTYFLDPLDHICKPYNLTARQAPQKWMESCSCAATCHTENVFRNMGHWPFRDAEEHRKYTTDRFERPMPYPVLTRERLRQPLAMNYTQACRFVKGQTPLKLERYIHESFSHHMLFVPQAKLVFCGIPKVGSTEWYQLFRYMMGAKDYVSLPHFKEDIRELDMRSLSPNLVHDILQDPTWTKAVFFRDPAERVLSAYLDKIKKHGRIEKSFRIPNKELSFTEFIDLVTKDVHDSDDSRQPPLTHADRANYTGGISYNHLSLHWKTDPHWRPQMWTCGLDNLFPMFDFVGSFDHMAEHSRILLERVGAWDTYGATYNRQASSTLSKPKSDPAICTSKAFEPDEMAVTEYDSSASVSAPASPGFNQRRPSDKHSTNSKTKFEEYYTPELLERVRKAYAMDYVVWNEVKDRAPEDVAAARDLPHIQKACKKVA